MAFTTFEDRLKWIVGMARWQFNIPLDAYLPLIQIIKGFEVTTWVFQINVDDKPTPVKCCFDRGYNSWKIFLGDHSPYKDIFTITDLETFAREFESKMKDGAVDWPKWADRSLDWSTYFEARQALQGFAGESGWDFDEFSIIFIARTTWNDADTDIVKIVNGDEYAQYYAEVTYTPQNLVKVKLLGTESLTMHKPSAIQTYISDYMAEEYDD